MGYRIDFRAVKERARFEAVLRRYGLAVQAGRAQHFVPCPFHRETDPSCRIDHARNRFRCFGCGAKGSILDFVAKLERSTIREAAALVAEWCGIATECADNTAAPATTEQHAIETSEESPVQAPARNQPLRISAEPGSDSSLSPRPRFDVEDDRAVRPRIL